MLGLVASGAVDPVYDGGGTHGLVWFSFGLSLALVARDTLLGGTFFSRDETDEGRSRVPLRIREGDLQIRIWQFEPVATTLAILSGLLASQAVDMRAAGNALDGDVASALWAAFALSLFLTIGGRLRPRPRGARRRRRQRKREERQQRWDEFGDEIEARVEEIFDDLQQRFRDTERREG